MAGPTNRWAPREPRMFSRRGRRSRSGPAGRRFLLSGSTWPPTPQCQDRYATAQYRSQRLQLAGRQLRQPHPRGGARAGGVGRRASGRGLRAPGPAQGRPARRHRLRAGQPDPRWRPLYGGGLVKQTVVEMDRGLLVVMAISDGSCLAVLAGSSCDVGVVAYEMTVLVSRTGDVLTPGLRAELQANLPR